MLTKSEALVAAARADEWPRGHGMDYWLIESDAVQIDIAGLISTYANAQELC